ncbi:hypothetical protein [Thermococcus sp.]|uniref:hypothetical protein n=1 Tax=Thermococcus sp. TaxID=35749 RepID=UPI0025D1C01C|nr:hypothetical protein [Thermococcus sp.]
MEVLEIKLPPSDEELRKILKGKEKRGVWSKLFGVAKSAPEFKEDDRVDARI